MAATIVVAAFAVRLLSGNVFASLERARQEIRKREETEQRLEVLVRELEARNEEA